MAKKRKNKIIDEIKEMEFKIREEAIKNMREVLQMTVESMIEHSEPLSELPRGQVQVFSEPKVRRRE